MIYCVWYPSGGFGHYINAILSVYGYNFLRPKNQPNFSKDGNSHALDLIAPVYYKDQSVYNFDFDPNINYSVLVDNGINNEGTKFQKFFPKSKIIKLCYSDFTWPVIAQTMIRKAMNRDINDELKLDVGSWDTIEPWAQREKYFLFLRDHPLRHNWKPDSTSSALMIEDLLDYNTLRRQLDVELNDFESFYQSWWDINKQYFLPVLTAQKILQGQFEPVEDIWTQAVVYYQIWCKYGIEVPHNDFANFFSSTEEIIKLIK
jgi:hypothetical protein